jgi:hypothetical protein
VHLSFASFESVPSFSRRFCPFILRINSFGLAAPSRYSRQDFGPSKLSFSASSAFEIFEAGLWSLEVIFFGQQRLRDIRSRTSVPRSYLFRPAAPSRYSRQDFGPSKLSLSASSAFEIFEAGFLVPRVISSGLAAPSRRLRQVSDLSSCFFRLNNTFRDPGSNFGPLNHLVLTCLPSYQRSSINMPEFWWHYTSSDAVCQIQR